MLLIAVDDEPMAGVAFDQAKARVQPRKLPFKLEISNCTASHSVSKRFEKGAAIQLALSE